nr:MAG TPA: hypothetical protein [Caudoviricetes sp.]DAQ47508.1 MAG TPA: hypothetical protein [Bacteriophage sp.]
MYLRRWLRNSFEGFVNLRYAAGGPAGDNTGSGIFYFQNTFFTSCIPSLFFSNSFFD